MRHSHFVRPHFPLSSGGLSRRPNGARLLINLPYCCGFSVILLRIDLSAGKAITRTCWQCPLSATWCMSHSLVYLCLSTITGLYSVYVTCMHALSLLFCGFGEKRFNYNFDRHLCASESSHYTSSHTHATLHSLALHPYMYISYRVRLASYTLKRASFSFGSLNFCLSHQLDEPSTSSHIISSLPFHPLALLFLRTLADRHHCTGVSESVSGAAASGESESGAHAYGPLG